MSIEFKIDDQLVLVSAHGSSSYVEVRTAFEKIEADPALQLPVRILIDARHTNYGPPADELGQLAAHLGAAEAYRGSRWAVVAPPNSHMFGVCRMFCCYAEFEGLCVETFSSYTAARAWLIAPEIQNINQGWL